MMTIWYPISYESLFFHLWQLIQGLNIASKLEWRKVILCSLQLCKAQLLSYSQEKAASFRRLGSNCC